MSNQWIAVCMVLAAVAGAPFLARALRTRGLPRTFGYLAGFALIAGAALWLRHSGGIPR
ncbi:MAG: hypothetical protein ABJE47_00050 [bacterium]